MGKSSVISWADPVGKELSAQRAAPEPGQNGMVQKGMLQKEASGCHRGSKVCICRVISSEIKESSWNVLAPLRHHSVCTGWAEPHGVGTAYCKVFYCWSCADINPSLHSKSVLLPCWPAKEFWLWRENKAAVQPDVLAVRESFSYCPWNGCDWDIQRQRGKRWILEILSWTKVNGTRWNSQTKMQLSRY